MPTGARRWAALVLTLARPTVSISSTPRDAVVATAPLPWALARDWRRLTMTRSGRKGDLEEIFEILVTSYRQRGGALPSEGDLCWRPATDVYETEDAFVVQLDLAGMDPTQIEVICDGEQLMVRGIRGESSGAGRKHFHTMEINVGPFVRRVPLPAGVDATSATARYQGGFLSVTFRKGEPREPRRRQIAVDR
jgi:HSP20 family protein